MNLGYAWAELVGRGDRSLLNIAGIATAVALFISLTSFSAAYQEAAKKPFQDMGADLSVQGLSDTESFRLDGREFVLPFKSRLITEDEIERIRGGVPGVEKVSPVIFIWNFNSSRFNTIAGVDDMDVGPARSIAGTRIKNFEFDSANQRYIQSDEEASSWISKGRFFEKGERGVAVVESHYAAWYGVKLGDVKSLGEKRFEVIGIVDIKEGSQIAASNIYIPLKDAQEILGVEEGANVLFIKAKEAASTGEVMKGIQQNLQNVEVTSSDTILQLMGGIAAVANRSALIASLIALAGAGLFIFKTTSENILARTKDMGVLKAVGWTGSNVKRQILAEVMLQCVIGLMIGVLLGYVVSQFLGMTSVEVPVPLGQSPAFTQEPEKPVQSIKLLVEVSPVTFMLSAGITLFSAGTTWFVLSRRVLKMRPAQALGYS